MRFLYRVRQCPTPEQCLHLADLEQLFPVNTPAKGSFKARVGFSLWFLTVVNVPQTIIIFYFACLHFKILFFAPFSSIINVHNCLPSISVPLLTGVKYGVWN